MNGSTQAGKSPNEMTLQDVKAHCASVSCDGCYFKVGPLGGCIFERGHIPARWKLIS